MHDKSTTGTFLIIKIEEKLASEKLVDVWELNQFHGYQNVM